MYFFSVGPVGDIVVFFCSPSGKLVQIEYALAAVAAGAPSVGIKGTVRRSSATPICCFGDRYMVSLQSKSRWNTIINHLFDFFGDT